MDVRACVIRECTRGVNRSFSRKRAKGKREKTEKKEKEKKYKTCDEGGEKDTLTLQAGHVLNASWDYGAVPYTLQPVGGFRHTHTTLGAQLRGRLVRESSG